MGSLTLATAALGVSSIAACNARLEVTDDNVGGAAGAAGAAGSGQAGSDGLAGAGGSGGTDGAAPTCDDGVRNADEEGVDCGGASCAACPPQRCTNGVIECDSGICVEGVCQPPSCDDGVQNGEEESVDCGGASECGPCLTHCHLLCGVSDVLIPVGCDPNADPTLNVGSWPRVSDDGNSIAFTTCTESSGCGSFHWTASGGTRALALVGGGRVNGASGDGQRVLVIPQVALGAEALVMSPDGTSLRTGMRPQPSLISADGTVVGVGSVTLGTLNLLRRRPDASVETLGELAFTDLWLTGASFDASVIVGNSGPSGYRPFRYSAEGGAVSGLDGLPETADGASIDALSRDGQVFAGVTALGNTRLNVYRWTAQDGVVELAPVMASTPGFSPQVMALSDDGNVLVFAAETNAASGDFSAFRWTVEAGAEALAPGIQSAAMLVSGDGAVVLGKTADSSDYGPFVWTQQGGARSIRAALETAGVDLRGWSFGMPEALSHDGRVAIGQGTCGGIPTVYRLVLPE